MEALVVSGCQGHCRTHEGCIHITESGLLRLRDVPIAHSSSSCGHASFKVCARRLQSFRHDESTWYDLDAVE
eukprot:2529780-Pyramimonas_sp.AAC.1